MHVEFEYYKNILCIKNFRQIQHIDSDLIALREIRVYGKDLKVLRLDKDSIILEGYIEKLEMGEEQRHDL